MGGFDEAERRKVVALHLELWWMKGFPITSSRRQAMSTDSIPKDTTDREPIDKFALQQSTSGMGCCYKRRCRRGRRLLE